MEKIKPLSFFNKTQIQVFFFEFCEIFKNKYLTEKLMATACEQNHLGPKFGDIRVDFMNENCFFKFCILLFSL